MQLRMRFQLKGCTNRPFFNIVVARNKRRRCRDDSFIEQVGHYDPFPNSVGVKLVGLDILRIRHWLGCGVELTPPVAHLLGLAGVTPIYPPTIALAKKRREKRAEMEKEEKEREEKEKAEKELEKKELEEKEKAEKELEEKELEKKELEEELGKVESAGKEQSPSGSETSDDS